MQKLQTVPQVTPKRRSRGRRAPGPRHNRVTGTLFFIRLAAKPLQNLRKLRAAYGDVARIEFANKRFILFSHPDAAQHILQTNQRNYRKSDVYEVLKALLGEGLLTSNGEFWLRQRRIAQPAFHKKRLNRLFDAMVGCIDRMHQRWEQQGLPDGRCFDIGPEMMKVTLDVVGQTLLSTRLVDQSSSISRALNHAFRLFPRRVQASLLVPNGFPIPGNAAFEEAKQQLHTALLAIIAQRRAQPPEERPDDLLTMLLEATDADTGAQMNDRQLLDEVLTIFVAGHETTAMGMSWLWSEVGRRPELQHALQHEVDTVLGQRPPTLEDLPRLQHIRRTIDETLRLHPPAFEVGRNALEADVVMGYELPKGFNAVVSIDGIHRHPEFWQEPEAFNPERFRPENRQNDHKFQYIPFGGGPRLCIGNHFALMEMTLLVAMILQRYTLTREPGWRVEPLPRVTLRLKYGLGVRLGPRS